MSFKDITGHDGAISFLRRSIDSGRIANAYIFCGPGGVGKKLTALNFAKALNCLTAAGGSACDVCPSCKKIDSLNHPDVRLVVPDGKAATMSIKINDIRAIIRDVGLKPYEAKKKVYVIDGADNLTEEAANALLKTLEEPSPEAMLILIVENLRHLPSTIRSRCQAVKFLSLGAPVVEEALAASHGVDKVKAHVLAMVSRGSLGGAIELIDDEIFNKRENIINALSTGGFLELDFDKRPKAELKTILKIMLTWYRDILVMKAGAAGLVNIDKIDLISSQALKMSFDKLNDLVKRVILTQDYLDQNANPRLAMTALAIAVG